MNASSLGLAGCSSWPDRREGLSATAVKTVTAQMDAAQRQIEAAQAQARQAKVNFDYATVRGLMNKGHTVKFSNGP